MQWLYVCTDIFHVPLFCQLLFVAVELPTVFNFFVKQTCSGLSTKTNPVLIFMKLQHPNIFDETIKQLNRSLILILSTIYEIGILVYTCEIFLWKMEKLSLIENERACYKYQINITGKNHIIHRSFIYFHTTFMHNQDTMCSLIVFNQNRWVGFLYVRKTSFVEQQVGCVLLSHEDLQCNLRPLWQI